MRAEVLIETHTKHLSIKEYEQLIATEVKSEAYNYLNKNIINKFQMNVVIKRVTKHMREKNNKLNIDELTSAEVNNVLTEQVNVMTKYNEKIETESGIW